MFIRCCVVSVVHLASSTAQVRVLRKHRVLWPGACLRLMVSAVV